MSKLILYLLEASVALAIFYTLYILLLRNVTFFSLNRFFLLAILTFSLLFPFVSLDFSPPSASLVDTPVSELRGIRMSYYDALEAWSHEGMGQSNPVNIAPALAQETNTSNVFLIILLAIYCIGLAALLYRLAWTYIWIHQLKTSNPQEIIEGVNIVKIPYPIAPFSFMNAVFIHADMLKGDEYMQIIAHEKIHIQQWHSIDLIFVQLLAALLWFNPVVWLLIKSLKTTHEYIADKKMINQGYPLVEYQSLLLSQLISNNSFGLVHNFNLSFIKKRITMMKLKESGWAGKAKVVLALSAAIVCSLIIVQCNTKLDEPNALDSNVAIVGQLSNEVSLPVLSVKGNYKFDGDLSNSLQLTIVDGHVAIDGKPYEVHEVSSAIEQSSSPENGIILIKVDKDQSMALVREATMELRKANRRKVLYTGNTADGQQVDMPLVLPPVLDNKEGIVVPKITDAYAKEHDMNVLKIDLGENSGQDNQNKVYDFVKAQMKLKKSNYVVSATYKDEDTYSEYFTNLFYIQEAFNQIYDERAQKMYGKSFRDLDRNDATEKNQYNNVRNGIPRAISIAEKD